MKLNVTAFALAASVLWGGAVLVVALANLAWPPYGRALLDLAASLYPGYHAGGSAGSAVVGALYGLVDGAIGGAAFAWLYNLLLRVRP
jgi:hypothetical protein